MSSTGSKKLSFRRLLASVLAMAMLLSIIPTAAFAEETAGTASNPADGFEIWFNDVGSGGSSIAAGPQSVACVEAGVEMAANGNSITVDGVEHFCVKGSKNPKPNAGEVPTEGTFIKVTAPADGTLTIYGKPNTSKMFYGIVNGEKVIDGEPTFANNSHSVSVKKGNVCYFYASGSNAEYAGVVFVPGVDQSFEIWFNDVGSGGSSIAAGPQSVACVEAGVEMAANGNSITVDGVEHFCVKGSKNPKPNAGEVPTEGTFIKVTAPAAGTVTIYGKPNTSKMFYGIVNGEKVIDGEPTFANNSHSVSVQKGDVCYFYASGSNAEYAGVVFAEGATPAPTPTPTPTPELFPDPVMPGQWAFKAFGTSVSSAANKLITDGTVPTAENPTTEVPTTIEMTSCTVKADGGIDKKGGKFVADSPADGTSFYYTAINPTTDTFRLSADVTINYQNPSLDGQEGFALMIRDSLMGSGSYYSNQATVTATKLPVNGLNGSVTVKDVVGARSYTGIVSPETASANKVVPYLIGFGTVDAADPDDYIRMERDMTYHVSLEKTAYGYVMSLYNEFGNVVDSYTLYIRAKQPGTSEVSSYAELDDPMTVQEADKAYVGFALARGCNATFSNIEYEVGRWNAADWKPQPTTYVDPVYQITSPATMAEETYTLGFKANADGLAEIRANGKTIDSDVKIAANVPFSKEYEVNETTKFEVVFTPDPNYIVSEFERLSDYSTQIIEKTVTFRSFENDVIYVSPSGSSVNSGASRLYAVDLATALKFAKSGQTILLSAGNYLLYGKTLTVERGRDGVTMMTDGGYATLDFGRTGGGFTLWGSDWHISNVNITGTKHGSKGMQVSGHNNIIERCNFFNNGNTGLQISGSSAETINEWPSNNLILNCTSMNNADNGYEDADGFAAKLTVGQGNVFDGCISAYNADDGWDLFAKGATGSIGDVKIQNSIAYRNGYIWANTSAEGKVLEFAAITCDDNGELTIDKSFPYVDAGNGNGFKMGGTNMPGAHSLTNSISYENKAKGIDSNSGIDIKAYDSTTYNNESYNIAMYTNNKSAKTGYEAAGVISFRQGVSESTREQFTLQSQDEKLIYNESTYLWNESAKVSANTAGETVSADWFISLDTDVEPGRRADGRIDMHGLLLLSDMGWNAQAGARGDYWGDEYNDTDLRAAKNEAVAKINAAVADCTDEGVKAFAENAAYQIMTADSAEAVNACVESNLASLEKLTAAAEEMAKAASVELAAPAEESAVAFEQEDAAALKLELFAALGEDVETDSQAVSFTLVMDTEAEIPEEDAALVADYLENLPDVEDVVCFDLSWNAEVAGVETAMEALETEHAYTYTIELPEAMQEDAESYDYVVLRIHGDECESIPAKRVGDTLVIQSNKFCTYAIVRVLKPVYDDGIIDIMPVLMAAAGVAAVGTAVGVGVYYLAPVWKMNAEIVDPNGAPVADARVELIRDGKCIVSKELAADGALSAKVAYGKYILRVTGTVEGECITRQLEVEAKSGRKLGKLVMDPAAAELICAE